MANECEARIKNIVRFQWLHLQFYSLSEFGGKEEKKENSLLFPNFTPSSLTGLWVFCEPFQADSARMNSCKEMLPKGNIWNLNHREERTQFSNAYSIPGTSHLRSQKSHVLGPHFTDSTLRLRRAKSLVQIKQLVNGKPGMQFSVFWFHVQGSFFYTRLPIANLNTFWMENLKSRVPPRPRFLLWSVSTSGQGASQLHPLWLFLRSIASGMEKETQVGNLLLRLVRLLWGVRSVGWGALAQINLSEKGRTEIEMAEERLSLLTARQADLTKAPSHYKHIEMLDKYFKTHNPERKSRQFPVARNKKEIQNQRCQLQMTHSGPRKESRLETRPHNTFGLEAVWAGTERGLCQN